MPQTAKSPGAEFTFLMAAVTGLAAMSIDTMLPALGVIASELNATDPNDRQLIIGVFFFGFAVAMLPSGALSDTYGRKPVLFGGLALYLAGTLLCLAAQDFLLMLAGRFLQGLGAAGPRIAALAMVRDSAEGDAMARINSYIMTIFIMVPVIAPALGQLAMDTGGWRSIFWGFLIAAAMVAAWTGLRQRETLVIHGRPALSFANIGRGMGEFLTNRHSMGYTLAAGCVFGALIGYLVTSQQIFAELYELGPRFPLVFALIAATLGLAAFTNGRLVMQFGMLRLSRLAVWAGGGLSAVFLAYTFWTGGHPPLPLLLAYLMGLFFCNGMLFGNLTALALKPMGHIAGIASALNGTLSTLIAMAAGAITGRLFDGTVLPVITGFTLMFAAAIAVMVWTESRPV